ncbi:universal stress protein [Dissulfurirhabdus thermomarina]|uniref:Universal stress protein n=1 Tax=Dissulfurirhabdus thermomarina TaxID=1765737 RepID=A0A6N9TY18_DISTH|nr:universal stress protein [Dissulfurirhabdus thermomarina]NDY43376.1 universal stress protein [Dissulfurirhabdus thermomarina]NMX23803.1 universal stress protein [Dissulfurirhabdus thermomarina]
MFEKALFPVDFSEISDKVLACTSALEGLGIRKAVLLHVTDVRSAVDFLGFDKTFYERHDQMATQELAARLENLRRAGIEAESRLVHDIPGKGVVHAARAEGCDIVVMGSHGRTSWKEKLLGGTTGFVVEHADVPVLVMRPAGTGDRFTCALEARPVTDHVCLLTDLSPRAEGARRAARSLAPRAARMTLFHVVESPGAGEETARETPPGKAPAAARNRLAGLAEEMKAAGAGAVEVELVTGPVREEVTRRLRRGDVTLAVMGTRGWGGFRELLLGSVSRAAVEFAAAPILLVRE